MLMNICKFSEIRRLQQIFHLHGVRQVECAQENVDLAVVRMGLGQDLAVRVVP